MPANEEVLGTQEAAKRLGVSVRTVQLWVENGTLEAWKTPGGHRRILRSSVEDALVSRSLPTEPAAAERLRVLIVEDDLAMQGYYAALFEILRPDAELTMAADGFEGLIELGKIAPHMMLVDVDMPGMDGITMLRRIVTREIGGDVAIAVVTGLNNDQLAAREPVPEGIPVYPKPLSVDRLRDMLDKVAPAAAGATGRSERGQ